jgi:antitoxin (DNA-binding transcriptional repressor) of toxin-antitoxin stability system
MSTITIQDAQARLAELVSTLAPGEEIGIVRDGRIVATLVASGTGPWPCRPGTARGILTILAEDEEHLDDFRESMD